MDAVGVATLASETREDLRVMAAAAESARKRLDYQETVGLEGCAHHLCRFYNAFEQMGLRICKAFENHIDDDSGWHTNLLQRLMIEIDGVRPAVVSTDLKAALNELKGFRHVFVHAYDLTLDREKLLLLVNHAEKAADRLPEQIETFFTKTKESIRE